MNRKASLFVTIFLLLATSLAVWSCAYVCLGDACSTHNHDMDMHAGNTDHMLVVTLAVVPAIISFVGMMLVLFYFVSLDLATLSSQLSFVFIDRGPPIKKKHRRQFFDPRSPPLY
jgi:hypothetical protein